jgi:hypothetical protein
METITKSEAELHKEQKIFVFLTSPKNSSEAHELLRTSYTPGSTPSLGGRKMKLATNLHLMSEEGIKGGRHPLIRASLP